jgi:urate oxidase
MKNTVYALARAHAGQPIEAFATAIGNRLLAAASEAERAVVDVEMHDWSRIRIEERPHDHAFTRGSVARRTATVVATPTGVQIRAGISGLGLFKSGGSAFRHFLRDALTTLADTDDRILATEIDAWWRYATEPSSFDFAWRTVRDALVETFAEHESASVQHTLYAMAAAALERCEQVEEVHLRMPNRHHLPVDLAPFGLPNHNEVFVATDAPYGLIEATVRRDDDATVD